MPVESVDIAGFLKLCRDTPVIDVRSPSEFRHAHIPGAVNVPLFTDEERSEIGTLYKRKGRETAVMRGLDFFGPRMKDLIQKVSGVAVENSKTRGSDTLGRRVLIHCWRGGMRSASVAWLLDLYGFDAITLSGGYKTYRSWVLRSFENPYIFKVLGGYTGSNKTMILRHMREQYGAAVLDLEGLASHRGSAFGSLGLDAQPSQEMFENLLADSLFELTGATSQVTRDETVTEHATTVVWMEDESQRIGKVIIPKSLWERMRTQPVVFLDVPFHDRLENICREYGSFEKDQLVAAITRIRKRLGGLEAKNAIGSIIEDDVGTSFEILLRYYDKTYEKSLLNRPESAISVERLPVSGKNPIQVASILMNL